MSGMGLVNSDSQSSNYNYDSRISATDSATVVRDTSKKKNQTTLGSNNTVASTFNVASKGGSVSLVVQDAGPAALEKVGAQVSDGLRSIGTGIASGFNAPTPGMAAVSGSSSGLNWKLIALAAAAAAGLWYLLKK